MKTNRKIRGRIFFFVIIAVLMLSMTVLISVGTTYGKYSKTFEFGDSDLTWDFNLSELDDSRG